MVAHNQWGQTSHNTSEYQSKATLPIRFITPFKAIGSVLDSASVSSTNNYDDAIKLTSTDIAFRFYGHSYIAIGLS